MADDKRPGGGFFPTLPKFPDPSYPFKALKETIEGAQQQGMDALDAADQLGQSSRDAISKLQEFIRTRFKAPPIKPPSS